jgi:glycosyltransferase involved in cell wall biosynthesis
MATHARFSILTPTYNRAHTLPRVFASLAAQALPPHEWIVVDDGSTDDTRDIVRGWKADSPFPIRYVYQANAGKPAAYNAGVTAATGDLLAVLDSDDWCVPEALARFDALWQDVPSSRRDRYTGITVNCRDPGGQLVGQPFPQSPLDSTLLDMWARGWLVGEKWGFHRLDVLRRFPFPIMPGEKFVPEGLVWNRIGREYLMRFVNETLRVLEHQPDGLTRLRLKTVAASPRGARQFYVELAEQVPGIKARSFALINAARFGTHASEPLLPPALLARFPGLAHSCNVAGWCAWVVDSALLSVQRIAHSARATAHSSAKARK